MTYTNLQYEIEFFSNDQEKVESAYKPGFVENNHSSAMLVAKHL